VSDPSGKFVYVTNDGFVLEDCFPNAPPGTLVAPCGNGTNYNISIYGLDAATGTLTFTGDTDCSGLLAFCKTLGPYDPTGKFAYEWSANGSDLQIYTTSSPSGDFDLEPTGQTLTGVGPGEFFFGPTGKSAYITHDTYTSIYSFDPATGALTATGTTIAIPSRLTFDPTGKFGYGMSNIRWDSWRPGDTDSVQIFRVDPATGALTLIGTVGT
jgi:DNA-binding beta-propeller fold protein YncE